MLSTQIVRTVCFADALDAALTPLEITRWLGIDAGVHASLVDVCRAFAEDATCQKALVVTRGFVTLRGREHLVTLRLQKLAVQEEKRIIATRAIGRLRHVPWLRVVALCNTVAMGLSRRESDIDVFIVTEPERLWITRLFVHLALRFGNIARRGNRIADHVCLSFFVTSRAANLAALRKTPSDPYFSAWLLSLLPLFDRDDAFEKFWKANAWREEATPGREPRKVPPPFLETSSTAARALEHFVPRFAWRLLERGARSFQRRQIFSHATSRVHTGGTDVVVTDDILKFHEEDRREVIRDAFEERLGAVGI